MAQNVVIDQYTLALEMMPQTETVRACAQNKHDATKFCEAPLSVERTRQLLTLFYGDEASVVDEYLGQLRDNNVVFLRASGREDCIFTPPELVRFGFNPDDFRTP